MLTIEIENHKENIFLVDAHAHLGKEEVRTGRGIDYRKTTAKDLVLMYEQLKYKLKKQENPFIKYDSAPYFRELRELIGSMGWLGDKAVVFPFNDVLRNRTMPRFHRSNEFILSRTRDWKYSDFLIGYCRVDPHDGEGAISEVLLRANQGMRGLKLHPISQEFLDSIVSPTVEALTLAAAQHEMPVTFDCQNVPTAQDIAKIIEYVSEDHKGEFWVVIAHFCFSYTAKELYELMKEPHVMFDISGIRGDNILSLFKRAIEVKDWSRRIMFGTDFNYFGAYHASDLITFLFSRKAADMGISGQDIKNILGENILRIQKPLWMPGEKLEIEIPRSLDSNGMKEFLSHFTRTGRFVATFPLFRNGSPSTDAFILTLVEKRKGEGTTDKRIGLLVKVKEDPRRFTLQDITSILDNAWKSHTLRRLIRELR